MNSRGYTILEAMLFLAISMALFAAVVGMFSSRISRTQFTNAVQELDAQLNSVINETAAGYYPDQGTMTCTASAGAFPPSINGGSGTGSGTHGDCVFIGKVLQYGAYDSGKCTTSGGTECTTINVFSLAAKNPTILATPPSGYQSLYPVPIAPRTGFASIPKLTKQIKLANGMRISKVLNGPSTVTGASALLLPLSAGSLNTGTASGQEMTQRIIPGSVMGAQEDDMATTIAQAGAGALGSLDSASAAVDTAGITICLASGTSNQTAAIVIGGSKHPNSTEVLIDGGVGC